jgi:hypothetical protein
MHLGLAGRGLAGALVALMLLNACAAVPAATGGSGSRVLQSPQRGGEEWENLGEARRAEVESALAGMWGVAAGVMEVGAVLEFNFWAEGGALTLLSLRRREWGGEAGGQVNKAAFARELRENLHTYVEGHTGSVKLTLRRTEGNWRADYETAEWRTSPMEAKTWPVKRVGVRAEVLEGLVAAGNEAASRLWAPAGGRVRWKVEIEVEDEWVTELETQPPRSWAGGASVKAAPELAGMLVNVLSPFSQGLGPRKVKVELEGASVVGARRSHWQVVAAEVIRPPPPAPENAEAVAEYRKMHEQIQRQWREETREGFQQMGLFSLEQIALWVVGGLVARGVGVVLEAVAPMIAKALARGGAQAVGWFRSLLARASTAEKQALHRLMANAETKGVESLTLAERNELQALFGRLNELTTVRLSTETKKELRKLAREEFDRAYPELMRKMRQLAQGPIDVHHLVPLDFAHLFPLKNINAMDNLVAVEPSVHRHVNKVWGEYTRRAGTRATPTEIEAVAKVVEKNIDRWYSRTQDVPASTEMLLQSTQRALQELNSLLVQAGK